MDSPIPLYNQTEYSREELIGDLKGEIEPVNLNSVMSAYDMAASVHEYQIRDDATPYFRHITRVAKIIIQELNYYNDDVIAAAYLHDVLEDSDIITAEVIRYNFGSYVSYIVQMLTKRIDWSGAQREQHDREYIDRIQSSSTDCKIVKFAERLDNFRCLEFGVKRDPFRYIEETISDYFPMAEHEDSEMLQYLVHEMNKVKGKLYG